MGERRDERVAGLVVASAPRRLTATTPEMVALAEQMVADGRGNDLLPQGASRASAHLTLRRS